MDYQAQISDIQGAIKIKKSARQSTAILDHKLIQARTKQLKAERRDERKRAKVQQS